MSSDCTCPHCGNVFSLAEHGPIQLDDIVVCGGCISVLLFDRQLQPRVAGPADYLAMSEDVRTLTQRVYLHAAQSRQIEIRAERHSRN